MFGILLRCIFSDKDFSAEKLCRLLLQMRRPSRFVIRKLPGMMRPV